MHLAHGTYSGGITNKEQVQVRRNPVVLEYIGMSDSVQKIYLHIFRQMGGCIIMHLCAHVCVLSSICFSALPTEKATEQ